MKKITRATFKSFVKKNKGKLLINKLSSFSGMTDCVEPYNEGFEKPDYWDRSFENTLGIRQLWIIARPGADFFEHFEDSQHIGIRYDNGCGAGIVAIKKEN